MLNDEKNQELIATEANVDVIQL